MKTSKRITLTALLCAGCLLVNACTTTSTAYQVQAQPLNPDLEKKILRETGLSGSLIGGVIGGASGALLGAIAGKLAGANDDQMKTYIIAGAVAGTAYGATAGYQKGTQQGQQMVSAGMTRDKARQLVKAARQENQRLAAFNAGLRKEISSAKAIKDNNNRKVVLASLKKQAESYQRDSNETIAMRNKALQSKSWGKDTSSQRSEYRECTNEQVRSNKALSGYITQVSQLQSMVY